MKNKGLILTLVALFSLLTTGCQNLQSSFSYKTNDFSNDCFSSFVDYFSSETGETIRLYEDGRFGLYTETNTFSSTAKFCGKYVVCNIKNSIDQTPNYEYYSFVFALDGEKITYLKNYSFANDCLSSQEFKKEYRSEYKPLYHYRLTDSSTISATYYFNLDIISKDDSLRTLNNQKLMTYDSEFRVFESLGYSMLTITTKVEEDSILECIKTINDVNLESLIVHPCFYLNEGNEKETYVNIDYYDLTVNDEALEAVHYGHIGQAPISKEEAQFFTTYDDMLKYGSSIKDADFKNAFINYCNTFDKAVFDEYNIVLTSPLISGSSENKYTYSATYIKDETLYVVFDPTLNFSGYQSVTASCHIILLPKQYAPNVIKTIS